MLVVPTTLSGFMQVVVRLGRHFGFQSFNQDSRTEVRPSLSINHQPRRCYCLSLLLKNKTQQIGIGSSLLYVSKLVVF